jgi:hypothetical protein
MTAPKLTTVDLIRMADKIVDQLQDQEEGEEMEASLAMGILDYFAAVPGKVEALYHVLRSMESRGARIKAEEDRLGKARQRLDRGRKRLDALALDLVEVHLGLVGGDKVKGETVTARYAASERVVVDVLDLSLLPPDLIRLVQKREPDLVAIKADLRKGREGLAILAHLEQHHHLVWS